MKQFFTEESKQEAVFTHEAQLLYVSKVEKCDCIHPRVMHSHEDLVEILLITGGKGSFFIHGVYYEVECGDIVVFNSGVIHDELMTKDNAVSLYCCAVKNLAVNGLRANALIPEGSCPVIPSMKHYSLLLKLFDSMFSLLEEQAAYASFVSQQLLTSLLYYLKGNLLEPHIMKEMDNTQIMSYRIKEYIDGNYNEDIQLQSAAEKLNISLYYLAHIFKDTFGYSPGNYLVRRRIGEAQTLLLTTNHSVIEIASSVGYNNVSHFNAIFKKLIGTTPNQYRKKYLERENNRD